MSNGKNMLNDMEFEHRLAEMGDNQTELIKFVARQQYEMSKRCPVHEQRIGKLESRTKKGMAASGGAGVTITAIVWWLIELFSKRQP